MQKIAGFLCLCLSAFLLTSCSVKRPYMIDQEAKLKPSEGKALVNFVRPSSFGKLAKGTIWDGDKLIGVSFGEQRFQYECEPGRHLFIAWSEWKSPVEADLLPNRVYFIALRIRMGWWRGRLHQVPLNKEDPLWNTIMNELPSLPNRAFDQEKMALAEAEGKAQITEYLQHYDQEVKGSKYVGYLRPEDGIPVD